MYGIELGNNQHSLPNNSVSTQSDLAIQMGMSVDTLQNYKMLADMIPELDDLVQTGIVMPTTALAMIKQLTDDEQLKLISSLDTTQKITKREVQQYWGVDVLRNWKGFMEHSCNSEITPME